MATPDDVEKTGLHYQPQTPHSLPSEHIEYERQYSSHSEQIDHEKLHPSTDSGTDSATPPSSSSSLEDQKRASLIKAQQLQRQKKSNRFSKLSLFRKKSKTPQSKDQKVNIKEKEIHDPLSHLPPHEKEVLQRQLNAPQVKVSIKTMFRYATWSDILIMFIAAICSIAAGAVLPLMTVIFGKLAGTFQGFAFGSLDPSSFNHELGHFTLYYVYLAVGRFVTTYVGTVGFIYTGARITSRMREEYLAAILRQNIGFFDKLGAGEITTRITADTLLVQEGISEKVSLFYTSLATFITAYVIGFIKYWKLTLIMSTSVLAIALVIGAGSRLIVKWNKSALDSYALGGTVAEEVLSSIRNATAFSTQNKLARQYDSYLVAAEKWGFRHKSALGFMIGILMLFIYLSYGLGFWQGSRYLVSHEGGVGLSDILTILMAVMIGAINLGNVGPYIGSFVTAMGAASKIYATIDRVSPLDPSSDVGEKLENVKGDIELKNIKHIYPSRPEVVVMEDVSLAVPAGKQTALVGASGSGKSTIVGLVERFYDPVGGHIFLDGVDIQKMNLRFLRQQISLVSQEPILFGTTIFENIAHGLVGTPHEKLSHDEKEHLIIEAAKTANAHSFISELSEGYETHVGERGFLLSGGQKQRIAIARAIVSDPKILLLDEATSALDTKSEGVVQAALDKAAQGRTTIIIAHRLSTIKTADNIVVMSEGRIVEQGTHDQLLERKLAYYNLVEAQKIAAAARQQQSEQGDGESIQDDGLARMATKASENNANVLHRSTTSQSSMLLFETDKSEQQKPQKKYSLWTLIKLTYSFNRSETSIMIGGLIFSIMAGAGHPMQAVFFSECIVALSLPPSQYGKLRHDIDFWAWWYFFAAWIQFLAYAGQGVLFAWCSERLVHRARDRSFRTMLRQNIGFFDLEENSAGTLTSFLSTQINNLAGISGATLGSVLNSLTTIIASFAVSLAIGWKLALVCISTVPVLLGCGYFRFFMIARFERQLKKAYEESASYACEATSAIRTVASLTREQDVLDQYGAQLASQTRSRIISTMKGSILFASSEAGVFLCIALGFWYGGTLIGKGEYSLFQFFVCFSTVIFGAQSAGTIFSFAPDMSKSRNAAEQLMTLFERQPPIDSWSKDGNVVEDVKGAIEFRNVHFRYPTRPKQPVLRGLNFNVSPGEYVALVGSSGCGKSTTIGLLERFYDPLSGEVLLDGVPITSINLLSYRSQLALVSQEPTLYQGTIRENILLGADHPDSVDDAAIEQASADANILSFIRSLPDGFATVVGNKGVMLSGGQKQRIAIARALLRNPKVLLLDEATSALDSESEKVVQKALDQAAKGRTTIAVAHRLSTIQNADRIFVFEAGKIVERGTHTELMRKKGRYFELVGLQSLEKTE